MRSLYQRLGRFDVAAVNDVLEDMAREAMVVVGAGRFGAPVKTVRTAFMRYVGQGHEIPVRLSDQPIEAGDAASIRASFDAAYARFYDRPVPGSDVEVMSFAVAVATETLVHDEPAPPTRPAGPPRSQALRDPVSGEITPWPVHDRAALPPGSTVHGPAIIAEDETSTLVGALWTAEIDARGIIILTREIAA